MRYSSFLIVNIRSYVIILLVVLAVYRPLYVVEEQLELQVRVSISCMCREALQPCRKTPRVLDQA